MHYEEEFVGEILMYRTSPTGEWRDCSLETVTHRLLEAREKIKELQFELEKNS